VGVIGSIVDWG